MSGFHDVALRLPVAFGVSGGPEHRVDVVELASGRERRNRRWSSSRRRWEAGGALLAPDEAHALIRFFEARGGRAHSFRFRDPLDWKSGSPSAEIAATDQVLGSGDGTRRRYALVKQYLDAEGARVRPIRRPVADSLVVAVAGAPALAQVDPATLEVVLASAPQAGAVVTAGFHFDCEVRFDVEQLELSVEGFDAVRVGRLALVEVLA